MIENTTFVLFSALYTAFEIRPTKNENYALEYVYEKGVLNWVRKSLDIIIAYLQCH